MERDLICINCPMGCNLHVVMEGDEVVSVTGNTCPRGKKYAISEVTHPTRMITSILPVEGGHIAMVSCKTAQPVDKEKIFDVMEALQNIIIQAPVAIGDVLVENPADCGTNIIATKAVQRMG